ncbi:MAG: LysM peptidoglycan-binding domain-containing protein [Nitrospirae bacterium]|nr:LysM peptidoglycan-binding domain-containing protein [Nitrospirota bacterium]
MRTFCFICVLILSFLTINASYAEEIFIITKKGDTLYKISRNFNVSVESLKKANNLNSSLLKTGKKLLIPVKADAKITSRKVNSSTKAYVVKKGDTLWKVSRRFGVSVRTLTGLNNLSSNKLRVGQRLIITEDIALLPAFNPSIANEIKALAESPEITPKTLKERLIIFARMMLDTPYRFGGSTFRGMDCSAYVQYAFSLIDVFLPRSAREQFNLGEPVNRENLSIGDLVFFRTYAHFPSHVGIYLGDNQFIHASSRERKVTIDSLNTPYYIKRFIGAKRLLFEEPKSKESAFIEN